MNSLVTLGNEAISEIVKAVKSFPIMKDEDVNFLEMNSSHLAKVVENTHMWRTDTQKMSIISDSFHPTLHSKFHQAIAEQKVQFEQAMYLAKEFELKKLSVEEIECDISDLTDTKRDNIKRRKLELELKFKSYELKNMQIAMKYRMDEIRGWQDIENQLLALMRNENISEEAIWNKNDGELVSMFFQTLTRLQGIKSTTDGAERNNLIALARFAVAQVKENGLLAKLKEKCSREQLESLSILEK